MRILTAGGGSGGHVTPVIAVVAELYKHHPDADICFWCDSAFASQAATIIHTSGQTVPIETIVAGKLRRYHSLPWWRQLLRVRTIVIPNCIDLVKIAIGFIQSMFKMIRWRPDVVFTKGGFVCLPIGLAARVLRIPVVIHDSDAHPGLTNRILSRWATTIATGAPLEYYSYPKRISRYTGIPVRQAFQPVDDAQRSAAKHELGIPADECLVVVTGGGLGAQRINAATIATQDQLTGVARIVLISGKDQYHEIKQRVHEHQKTRLTVLPFVGEEFVRYLTAADVVVSRAGMTTLLELAALQKPVIVIPNAYLTGGHQLKNADVFADRAAVVVLHEDEFVTQPTVFAATVTTLLANHEAQSELARNIGTLAMPNAARDVAAMIVAAASNSHKKRNGTH
jgi:UDP-N-acetylglucosamine--N-acetylmuramyl-(pentapeptide) pyrophosphoryl-undecaprenol N-acetylglucosamine transferase